MLSLIRYSPCLLPQLEETPPCLPPRLDASIILVHPTILQRRTGNFGWDPPPSACIGHEAPAISRNSTQKVEIDAIASLNNPHSSSAPRQNVDRDPTSAVQSVDDLESGNNAAPALYAPPPGPPPGQSIITAVDGTTYTEAQLHHLIGEVKDYQLTHGSLLKLVAYETESSVAGRPVGASILPTSFPRTCFNDALDLQHAFNELYIRVASDPEWLHKVLKPLIQHDSFIAALWDIYIQVRDAGAVQSTVCAIFRSDYMLHQPRETETPQIKQVEINTFSCAGACHAERIASMHNHLARVRGVDEPRIAENLPSNQNTLSIVNLLRTAHETYISTTTSSISPKCILITVQPQNFNIADERPIQNALISSGIPCFRGEWPTLLSHTTLTPTRTLLYTPSLQPHTPYEVTVIYYRGGYDAAEYRAASRNTRLRLELSTAIKCPDILTHLTTCKSVQSALSQSGEIERFLQSPSTNPNIVEKLRKTFTPMATLSPTATTALEIALDPDRAKKYILKPNRDGGGHNVYRDAIPPFLASKDEQTWEDYVLMELIEPPETTMGTLLMPGEVYHGEVVSELGMLGTCMWKRGGGVDGNGDKDGNVEIVSNDVAGWTFKTKPRDVDEMSVVKGYGCFDCPWLVD